MDSITRQKCHHHPGREAVARCPVCTRYFCRECITEHQGRVLCATCLQKRSRTRAGRGFGLEMMMQAGRLALGLMLAWMFFYYLGRVLLLIPSDFHDGVFWQTPWWGG